MFRTSHFFSAPLGHRITSDFHSGLIKMACASKIFADFFPVWFASMQDKAIAERWTPRSKEVEGMGSSGGLGGSGGPGSPSVGFTVAVHVAVVFRGHLCAVKTVQEPSGDLRHHGSVGDGLGHPIDRPLKQQGDTHAHSEQCSSNQQSVVFRSFQDILNINRKAFANFITLHVHLPPQLFTTSWLKMLINTL